jgi:hypothetical protein
MSNKFLTHLRVKQRTIENYQVFLQDQAGVESPDETESKLTQAILTAEMELWRLELLHIKKTINLYLETHGK